MSEPGDYIDTLADHADWEVFTANGTDASLDYRKPNGDLLFALRRGAIPKELCDLAVSSYLKAGQRVSTNRGFAAGAKHRTLTTTGYERAPKAQTGIIGYLDSPTSQKPCRLTSYSRDHFEKYTAGIPFIKALDDAFAMATPEAHARQKIAAAATPFRIADTAFSTVTVNYNFRTAVHRDAGDFREGFGTLCVCSSPGMHGGLILFPDFKVAIELGNGDFLAMDVHEYHANSPLIQDTPADYRLSFVAYLRERIAKCPEINERLGGAELTTERMIADLFAPDPIPEARVTGKGPQGHDWWIRENERILLEYKFKRYVLKDKNDGTVYKNLGVAWEARRPI